MSLMSLVFEFKVDPGDEPFNDSTPFEKDTIAGEQTRGQLIQYLNAIRTSQPRTRTFGVYIRRQWCRLLCHTQSGTFVSTLFNWTKEEHLVQFIWRYGAANRRTRGHDTTVTTFDLTQDPQQTAEIREALGVTKHVPLYVLSIDGQGDDGSAQTTQYVVATPFTRNHIYPTGRGTRCFKAYALGLKKVVLLKDYWRITQYDREGETYALLERAKVRHITSVIAHGDVKPDSQWHSCFIPEGFPSNSAVRDHTHYRIAFDTIGDPLTRFKRTRDLVEAVLHGLEGTIVRS